MDRPSGPNSGFTMLEMLLTMSLVSILMLIGTLSIPKGSTETVENEIEAIGYFFQNAQTRAMSEKARHPVDMDRTGQKLVIRNQGGKVVGTYPLGTCILRQGGLDRLIFNSDGSTNQFGRVRFDCLGENVNFVFQIQRGRFRVER